MTELENLWRRKSDEQLLEAAADASEYNEDGQRIIRAELARRRLEVPSAVPITFKEAERVSRLYRRFARTVLAQWLSLTFLLYGWGLLPLSIESVTQLAAALVIVCGVLVLPITGYKLLQRLEVVSPGRIAFLMYMPLFSLLALFGLRSFSEKWGKLHGVEVGFLGPTEQSLAHLRDLEGT